MTLRTVAHAIIALVVVLALSPHGINAQDPGSRNTLLDEGIAAANVLEFARAADLLMRGIDPKAGPIDDRWRAGVRRTAEVLRILARDSAAVAVLRWSLRIDSGIRIPEESVARELFIAAQEFVDETSDPDSVMVESTWDWGIVADDFNRPGALTVQPIANVDGARVVIVGRDILLPRSPRNLPTSSYELLVTAEGYQPVRVWREVLPNVTTSLAFRLRPDVLVAQERTGPRPAATPEQLGIEQSRGGGFPKGIALLGALGAGAAAYFLLKGGGDPHGATPGEPGGIIVSLPKR